MQAMAIGETTAGPDDAQANASFVVVVTHGRSGSTLVQALLNSFDGWRIKGENMDFPRGLYQADRDMRRTLREQWRDSKSPSAPWFDSTSYDASAFRADLAQALRRQLARGAAPGETTFGFKEIRFDDMTADGPEPLLDYVDFLADALSPCKFILLSRDIAQTARSGWFAEMAPEAVEAQLRPFQGALDQIARNRPEDAFRIDYADLKVGSQRLLEMLEFLDLPQDEDRVEAVLGASHSYKGGRGAAERPLIFIPPKEWKKDIRRAHELQAEGDADAAREIYADHVEKVRRGVILRLPASIAHRSGVTSYTIVKAPRLRLAFFPVPGAAAEEVLNLLGDAENSGGDPLAVPDPSLSLDDLENYKTFTIIRDPVERFVAAFARKVGPYFAKSEGLSPDFSDLNHFALNLREAQNRSFTVRNHFCRQGLWLGDRLDYLQRVYTADDLGSAARRIAEKAGRTLPAQEAPAKPSLAQLSRDALNALIDFYREDYALFSDHFDPTHAIEKWEEDQA